VVRSFCSAIGCLDTFGNQFLQTPELAIVKSKFFEMVDSAAEIFRHGAHRAGSDGERGGDLLE